MGMFRNKPSEPKKPQVTETQEKHGWSVFLRHGNSCEQEDASITAYEASEYVDDLARMAPKLLQSIYYADDRNDMDDFNEEIETTAEERTTKALGMPPQPLQAEQNQSEGKRRSGYDLGHDFFKNHHIKNYGGILYIYRNLCYTRLSKDIAEGLILEYSRTDIKRDGNSNLLRQIYEFLRAESNVNRVSHTDDNSYVVFLNGRLNLRTWQFEDNGPDVFTTTYINTNYGGKTPKVFYRFLDDVTCGDKNLQERIWEVIGLCLTADMNAKVMILIYGVPNSGKSLLLKILKSFFVENEGECTIPLHEFGDRFTLSDLSGKRVVSDGDYSDTPLLPKAVAIIKKITGSDSVRVEQKGVDAVTINPTCKIVVVSNHAIKLKKHDSALSERVLGIHFKHEIPRDERDRQLLDKIREELPGIAMIALEHYKSLKERGYQFTEVFDDNALVGESVARPMRVEVLAQDQDEIIKSFFSNVCERCEDGFEYTQDLFEAYIQYCDENSYSSTGDKDFSTRFGKITQLEKKKHGTRNGYLGVKLKVSEED